MSNNRRLEKAFAKALGIQREEFESLEYRGIPEWDSVAHMVLIGELESEFDVMLNTDDVIGMSSFRIAREILSRHGVDFSA